MDTSCRFQRQLFKQFPTRRERSRRICLPIFRGLSPERLHYSRFDNGSHKYIIYSKEGKLFREINLVDSELNYLLHAEGDTYFCSGSFSNGKSEIIVSDTALRVKSSILPFDPTDDYVTRGGIMLTTSVQRCGPKLCLFNHIYSDSVFLLTPDGLKPEFILRKGKYAPSLDDVKQFMKWNKMILSPKASPSRLFPDITSCSTRTKTSFRRDMEQRDQPDCFKNCPDPTRYVFIIQGNPLSFPFGHNHQTIAGLYQWKQNSFLYSGRRSGRRNSGRQDKRG